MSPCARTTRHGRVAELARHWIAAPAMQVRVLSRSYGRVVQMVQHASVTWRRSQVQILSCPPQEHRRLVWYGQGSHPEARGSPALSVKADATVEAVNQDVAKPRCPGGVQLPCRSQNMYGRTRTEQRRVLGARGPEGFGWVRLPPPVPPCLSAGTGRRARLKPECSKGRAGSKPAWGTNENLALNSY